MGRPKKADNELIEKANELLAQNMTILKVAEILKVNVSTLHKNGIKRGNNKLHSQATIDRVKELYIDKQFSASETAKMLDTPLSRGQVIGIAFREGWSKAPRVSRPSPQTIAARIKAAQEKEEAKLTLWKPPQPEPAPIVTPKPKQAKPFAYAKTCRWFDEPCSEPVTRGAYCEAHGARVYAGLPGKKKAIGVK